MKTSFISRREFLGLQSGALLALSAAKLSGAVRSPLHPIRLGAPLRTETADPEEWARAHRQAGYSAAYAPNVGLTDAAALSAYRDACRNHNLVIAEVGRWVNLLDRDPSKRAANLKTVTEGLALAEELDARCCVDIAGSLSEKEWFGPHPENLSPWFFDAAVENARKIIDAVKPKRARFCYEMMGWALPDSADSCRRFIRAVDRKAFGAHLDPCNLVNSPGRFYGMAGLIRECIDKLGRHIVSCHAKDLQWIVEMNVHFKEVIPGTGVLDYALYLRELARLPHSPPLMLEHLQTPAEYLQGRDHILQVGRDQQLDFA